jgi:hypothetical protein
MLSTTTAFVLGGVLAVALAVIAGRTRALRAHARALEAAGKLEEATALHDRLDLRNQAVVLGVVAIAVLTLTVV